MELCETDLKNILVKQRHMHKKLSDIEKSAGNDYYLVPTNDMLTKEKEVIAASFRNKPVYNVGLVQIVSAKLMSQWFKASILTCVRAVSISKAAKIFFFCKAAH